MDLIIKALVIMATLTLANILLRTTKALLKPVPRALCVREYLATQGMTWDKHKLIYLRNGRMVEGWELREALKDGF